MAKLFQVSDSFVGNLNGAEVTYHEGDVVDEKDPALRKWPHLFRPLGLRVGPGIGETAPAVEQATAAPGEQRGRAITVGALKGRS